MVEQLERNEEIHVPARSSAFQGARYTVPRRSPRQPTPTGGARRHTPESVGSRHLRRAHARALATRVACVLFNFEVALAYHIWYVGQLLVPHDDLYVALQRCLRVCKLNLGRHRSVITLVYWTPHSMSAPAVLQFLLRTLISAVL